MPLSDREQQILQEIERHLYEHDPKFARGVSSKTLHGGGAHDFRRGLLLFGAGFALLVAFFFRPAVWIGVAAFLLMLAGAVIAYHNGRRVGTSPIASLRQSASAPFRHLGDRMSKLRRRDDT